VLTWRLADVKLRQLLQSCEQGWTYLLRTTTVLLVCEHDSSAATSSMAFSKLQAAKFRPDDNCWKHFLGICIHIAAMHICIYMYCKNICPQWHDPVFRQWQCRVSSGARFACVLGRWHNYCSSVLYCTSCYNLCSCGVELLFRARQASQLPHTTR